MDDSRWQVHSVDENTHCAKTVQRKETVRVRNVKALMTIANAY